MQMMTARCSLAILISCCCAALSSGHQLARPKVGRFIANETLSNGLHIEPQLSTLGVIFTVLEQRAQDVHVQVEHAISSLFYAGPALKPAVESLALSQHAMSNSTVVAASSKQPHIQQPCNRHLSLHPSEISCPGMCPFVRAEPTRFCQFKCVAAQDCGEDNPLTSFANPENGRCEACLVPACQKCTYYNKRVCAVCQDGFSLHDGKCLSNFRHYWWTFYAVLAVILLPIVVYAVQLLRRKEVNGRVLRKALDYRFLSSLRNLDKGGVQFPLDQTDMSQDIVNGPATMLHFRWMWSLVLYAAVITGFLLPFAFWFSDRGTALKADIAGTFEGCEEHVQEQKALFTKMEAVYFAAVVIIYLGSTAASIYFAKQQRLTYDHVVAAEETMQDFALICKGFPILKGSENVETEFVDFLRNAEQFTGLKVVGVSMCWNFRKHKKDVEKLIADEKHGSFMDTDTYFGQHSPEDPSPRDHRYRSSCCDPELKCVDALLGFGNLPCAGSGSAEEETGRHVNEVLDDLETTATCFVVFGTAGHCEKALISSKADPLVYRGNTLSFHIHDFEPLTVLWDGYGCPIWEFYLRLAIGFLIICLAIILLDIFFYAPYVQYIMSYSTVAGMTQGGFVSGTLLGLLITVCNQIIYQVITMVAANCGWCSFDNEMRFYVFQYTIAVMFNTVVDLWTVIILARGYSTDQMLEMQASMDTTMSPKAIAEQPSLQRALYIQIGAYIFPSCFLLPFLIEPLASTAVPFLFGKKLVGSRKSCTVPDAEGCLACPPYDLSRYGDVLVNLMLCCIMFGFTYPSLWTIWVYFIISMFVVYVWDKTRVLRYTFRSYYSSMSMEKAAQWMMAMPCGIIAACITFRIYGAMHKGFLEDMINGPGSVTHHEATGREIMEAATSALTRHTVVWFCLATFIVHCVIHIKLLDKVADIQLLSKPEETEIEEEAGRVSTFTDITSFENIASKRPASWFTVNPIHCLRSKYKYEDDPPCTLYQIGKPFLIQRNPSIGVYYEQQKQSVEKISYEERNKQVSWREHAGRYIAGAGNDYKPFTFKEFFMTKWWPQSRLIYRPQKS